MNKIKDFPIPEDRQPIPEDHQGRQGRHCLTRGVVGGLASGELNL